MPSLSVRITVISFKKPDWLSCTGIDADFALLAILTGRPIRLQQSDVILRVRLPHASRLRFDPGNVPRVMVVSVCPKPSIIRIPVRLKNFW